VTERKPLAHAHRALADAEHSIEEKLLDEADVLPDPEQVRRRARSLSENARGHDRAADRIDERGEI
jgi:hypothetical protein